MEKPKINFSVARSVASFKGIVGRSANPDVMWRFVLIFFLCAITVLCVFAYVTYVWAGNTELLSVPPKTERDGLSLTDLKNTIVTYEKKEETYQNLLLTHPDAPEYARKKDLVVATSSIPLP